MEGAPQPTRIAGPRPRRGSTIERARDRVLHGTCGNFYYRITTVSQNPIVLKTQAWTAQQLRNATMDEDAPAVLLRDRDDKFGLAFDRAARGVGAKVIRTAVRAPNMNAVSERFVGSVRRELLDHVLVLDEGHLGSLLRQYQLYFNESRPHQGIGQRVPTKPVLDIDLSKPIEVTSVLGGLHVDYRRAA